MPSRKKNDNPGKLKIRGGKNLAEEISNENITEKFVIENPIKRQIRINQFPWTEKQKDFFKVALHPSTNIVFVNGPAGTSKTLLSVYCALQMLNMKCISDIMYLRSAEEKLKFFNLPFLDKLDELLGEGKSEKLMNEKRVSMFPVNFARGMNWNGKCIILDEAQNSTLKEITTVLTRMGKNSRCFILADPMQTDLKCENSKGGFQNMLKTFSDEESLQHGIYTFNFTEEDIMRSELVKFLVSKINKIKP